MNEKRTCFFLHNLAPTSPGQHCRGKEVRFWKRKHSQKMISPSAKVCAFRVQAQCASQGLSYLRSSSPLMEVPGSSMQDESTKSMFLEFAYAEAQLASSDRGFSFGMLLRLLHFLLEVSRSQP